MHDANFTLDHNKFTFDIIKGTVQETKIWAETIIINDAANTPSQTPKTQTKSKNQNKREFWLKTPDDKDYHYIVNANRVPLNKDQDLKLLITSGKKAGAVLIFNEEDKELYTNISIWNLAFNEAPFLNIMLVIAAIIGLFFAFSPMIIITVLYTILLLFIAIRWIWRLNYYRTKINAIKTKHFERPEK